MRTGLVSLIMIGGGLWLFFHETQCRRRHHRRARTAVVNVIVMVEVAYLFSCRSLNHSLFSIGFFTNRLAILGATCMVAAQMLFTYTPVMNRLFQSTPLSLDAWTRILAITFLSFIAVELEKWIRFGGNRGKNRPPE
jgi:cation-transporting P-type ATPase F